MPSFSIIVEGAHDASFLGQLLKNRGFKAARTLSAVPEAWKILFPVKFPTVGDNLDRVVRFPEIFIREDLVVGITTSGSDSQLISSLRSVLDALGSAFLSGAAVFVDVDTHTATDRFAEMRSLIEKLNSAAAAAGEPGYPIPVPDAPGVMCAGSPAVGIFLFPDNAAEGALEDILFACAQENHEAVSEAASKFISGIDGSCPVGQQDLTKLRSGMGRKKAVIGAIANVLKPGVSVASSLAQTSWLHEPGIKHPLVAKTDDFLEDLLKSR